MAFELRILAGANEGATCPLQTGEYIIGTEEECDLILADGRIAERHITIAVDGDDITLSAAASPVWIGDDTVEEGDSVALEAFQPFRIGVTVMAVGPEDDDWPAIDIEAILRIGRAAEAAPEDDDADSTDDGDGAEASEGDAAADDDGENAADTDDDAAPDAGDPDAASASDTEPPPEADKGALAVAALLTILAVAGLGGAAYLVLVPPQMDTKMMMPQPDAMTVVRGILSKIPDTENLRVMNRTRGRIDVEGIVTTRQQVALIRERLRDVDIEISLRLKPLDELLRSVSGFLGQLKAPLEARVVDNGRAVEIVGYLPDQKAIDKLKTLLDRDLPGAPVDYSAVLTMDKVAGMVRRRLNDAGLGGAVRTEAKGNELRLTGTLRNPDHKARVQTAVAIAKSEFGRFITVSDETQLVLAPVSPRVMPGSAGVMPGSAGAMPGQAGAMPGQAGTMPGQAAGGGAKAGAGAKARARPVFNVIVVGERVFVRDSSGARYGLGDRLPDGYVVISIDPDFVVAAKDGKRRQFKIGQ